MAPPTKLTPEITAKICEALRVGNYPETAAAFAGVSIRTFLRWMARGTKARSGIYKEFAKAVVKAERDGEVGLTATVRKGAQKDWRAASFILERRYRERWGKSEQVEVKGTLTHKGGVRIMNLPPEEPDETALPKAAPPSSDDAAAKKTETKPEASAPC